MTDADLLLGRLDPGYFLGGEMKLDRAPLEAAFAAAIPSGSGFDARTAALGVQRIVDETMAAATRLHFAEKGKDPRSHTLIAFGGAGPVHAHHLARLLRIGRVVIPFGAGVASALGFLVAPPATDMVRTYVTRLEQADWERVNAMLEEMRALGRGLLIEAGVEAGEICCRASADMRHVGQGFEIPVPLPAASLSAGGPARDRRGFLRGLPRAVRPRRRGGSARDHQLAARLPRSAAGHSCRTSGFGERRFARGREARLSQGSVRNAWVAGMRRL